MAAPRTRLTKEEYEEAARAYLESLPLEHFMEATPQSTQRAITDASFALLEGRLADFHPFGELLVQRFFEGNLSQVVPDNMVVLGPLQEKDRTYFSPEEEEQAQLFWTLEYVSPSSRRKDYKDSFQTYEKVLKVPFYLLFEPERGEPRLHRLAPGGYALVEANAEGRLAIPELELEVGLVGRWLRYWHRGELLRTPAELQERLQVLQERQRQLDEREQQLKDRDRALKTRSEELKTRDQQVKDLGKQLQERSRELEERARAMEERDRQLQAVLAALRPVVETRDRQANREDILAALPATLDSEQLTRWLAELP